MRTRHLLVAALLVAQPARAQTTSDPFPAPIEATQGVVRVGFTEFATLPDIDGLAARTMLLLDEPGTRRLFVNDMRGPLYSVSYDGRTVTPYVDISAPGWGVAVQSGGNVRGMHSFAFHPQFNQAGTRGYGRFYTLTDTSNMSPTPDFTPGGGGKTHHTVLLEWTAKNPAAATYDGGAPRELMRVEQPFVNHNGGLIAFNPTAAAGTPDFGLLYIGFADGGTGSGPGGDPLGLAQNLGAVFGKLLRIDPLGSNSANGRYGIPADNPFAGDAAPNTLGEIYAYGFRNPQRFTWDPKNRNLFITDIGQDIIDEINLVTKGANYGWSDWEGSITYGSKEGGAASPPRDARISYPIVEYGHADPLLQARVAVTIGYVYRGRAVPQLANLLLFGDFPSGEIFYVNADRLPTGGQDAIRRVLFNDNGASKTLLQLIKDKNAVQGKPPALRADLRFGRGPDNQIFILNKRDGVIRLLVR